MRKVVAVSDICQTYGVTAEQVDTCLCGTDTMGRSTIEIYDGVIEQLLKRTSRMPMCRRAKGASASCSRGDSVDAWSDVPYRHFFNGEPVDNVKFSFSHDENWEKGDDIAWRFLRQQPIVDNQLDDGCRLYRRYERLHDIIGQPGRME